MKSNLFKGISYALALALLLTGGAFTLFTCKNNTSPKLETVATPTADPQQGTYNEATEIELMTTTAGASIHYTINGNDPTASSATYTAGAITLSEEGTYTIKAIAIKEGMSDSGMLTAEYTIDFLATAMPIADPPEGTYKVAQSVELTTTTQGASIYYTIDDSEPSEDSTPYTTPIDINGTTTIKAIALKEGRNPSSIMTATYSIVPVLQPPVVSANESVVSLVQSDKAQASQLTYTDIKEMVDEAIRLAGGLEGIVATGNTVVLKPNVVAAFYSWGSGPGNAIPGMVNGIATDWRVIQAVAENVRAIIGNTGKIWVMEGPATGSSSTNHFNAVGWTMANLTAVDEIIGLETEGTGFNKGVGTSADVAVTLSDPDYTASDSGGYTDYYKNDGKYWVNKKMLEADALICIPVLKTHNTAAAITGAIKNIGIGACPPRVYGISDTNMGRNDMVNHNAMNIHDWISDYYRCLPADFVVMDGLQGLQNGPGGQGSLAELQADQKNLRCILASKDALAIDIVEANIMNKDWAGERDASGNPSARTYLTNLAEKDVIYARGEIGKANPQTIPHRGDPKDIVVVGYKKVDDVRGNAFTPTVDKTASWSATNNYGVIQNPRSLSAADQTKPTVTITSATFSGSNLTLGLNLSTGANNNVVKIDVYVDGQYFASKNTGMTNFSLDAASIASGSHNIEVRAFTKYMASATATRTITK